MECAGKETHFDPCSEYNHHPRPQLSNEMHRILDKEQKLSKIMEKQNHMAI